MSTSKYTQDGYNTKIDIHPPSAWVVVKNKPSITYEQRYLGCAIFCTVVCLVVVGFSVYQGNKIQNSYEWTPVKCEITKVDYTKSFSCSMDDTNNNNDYCYEPYVDVKYIDPVSDTKATKDHVCMNVDCSNVTLDRYQLFISQYKSGDTITCYLDETNDKMKLSEDSSDFPAGFTIIIVFACIICCIAWTWPCIKNCDD